jgi:hypothetical protein
MRFRPSCTCGFCRRTLPPAGLKPLPSEVAMQKKRCDIKPIA